MVFEFSVPSLVAILIKRNTLLLGKCKENALLYAETPWELHLTLIWAAGGVYDFQNFKQL